LPHLQTKENLFERRRKVTGAQQQRGGFVGERVDYVRPVRQREPVVQRDM
jgi:hypothetical protein